MKKYEILIKYRTGDSFSYSDREDTLELDFSNLEVAKENLQRIKKHYEYYQRLNNWRIDKDLEKQLVKNEDWFAQTDWDKFGENIIKLKTDEGKDFQLYVFWTGYFEKLYSAEIIMDHSDTKIYF